MRSKWKIWIPVLIVVLALGGFIINKIQAQPAAEKASRGVQAVRSAAAEKTKSQKILQVTGTIDAADRELITARVGGIVESLHVDNGDLVKAGQTLIQIESQGYESLVAVNESALTKAEVQLNSTRTVFERMEKLHEIGAVAEQDFENTRAAYIAAQADVSAASIALDNARRDLGHTRVSAPINGLAANRNVIRGQMVAPGTPLMEVQDLAEVFIYISIGQDDVGSIKTGMTAEVTVDAFPGHIFEGVLTSINPAANPQGRVFTAKVTAANPDDLLRAGMFANVKIHTGAELAILSVPEEALTTKQEQFYVFVPQGDAVKMIPVEIGQVYDGRVEITQGLTEGQVVITSNINKLKENDRIQIVAEQGV